MKYTLAIVPKTPSSADVIASLNDDLEVECASFAEDDGTIRDVGCIHRVACLQRAITMLGGVPKLWFPTQTK